MAGDVGGRSCTDSELLLHPELLSQEFLLLTLEQVGRSGAEDERVGLPGRGAFLLLFILTLNSSEWVCLSRLCFSGVCFFGFRNTAVDGVRKRPLIVFDGSSTSTTIKVKKTENGDNDRLKPPPQNHDLTHRKSPSDPVKLPPLSPGGTTSVKLKRAAPKEEAEAVVSTGWLPY
ncbi:ashwin [Trichechus manatus latirostris]|uniref:Ashwin n=1 Tax=Trichechus manatus latirostris TaxID=127582 RepID=A0A2Y9QWF2_TRIMA|nr:ashwin [Trichechus manatus latirostris]